MNTPGLFSYLSAYALVASAVVAAPNSLSDARAALSTGIDEVSGALQNSKNDQTRLAQLDSLVARHFAFATTTRLAVGPTWRSFTEEDRSKTTSLFSRLIVRSYAERIKGEVTPKIVYGTAVEIKAGRVEIPTQITNAGQTYSVTYRLELDNSTQQWLVYDVVAEGVSLISNYRSQFEPIIQRGGASALISTLETKLADSASR